MEELKLVKPEKPKLVRGQSYMAFVKVTPYYEENNPIPIKCTFNELIYRKKKEEHEDKTLLSTIKEVEKI